MTDRIRVPRFRLRLLAVVTAAVLGGFAAIGSWIRPAPRTPFVAVCGDRLHTPLVPNNLAAANDCAALIATACLDAESIQLAPGADGVLVDAAPDESRVVYVSAYATRGDDGRVLLMTEDFDPIAGLGGLPLEDVLGRLERQRAPALLVLDLAWRLAEGRAGLAPCDAGAAVHARLRERSLPGVATLVSCSPGEVPNNLPAERRTAFGYFFAAGLSGAADGWNPTGVTDGRVSALEVSRYVVDRVAGWTKAYAPTPQTPVLYSGDAADFVIAAASAAGEAPAPPEEAPAYPEWLTAAWGECENWRAGAAARIAPRLVRRYEAELLDAERKWRWTGSADRAATSFESKARSLRRKLARELARVVETPRISVAEMPTPPSDELVTAWLARFAAGEDPEAEAAFDTAIAAAEPQSILQAAVVALERTGQGFANALSIVADFDRRQSDDPTLVELEAVRRLADLAAHHPTEQQALLVTTFRTVLLRERVLTSAGPVACFADPIAVACAVQQQAWAAVNSPGFAARYAALRLNGEAHQAFSRILTRLRILTDARDSLDEAFRVLPDLAPLVRVDNRPRERWRRACQEADSLSDALANSPIDSSAKLDRLARQSDALLASIERLTAPLSSAAIEDLCEAVRAGDRTALIRGEALLQTPLLTAPDRADLYQAIDHLERAQAEPLLTFAHSRAGAGEPTAGTRSAPPAMTGAAEWDLTHELWKLAGFEPPVVAPPKDNEDPLPAPLRRIRSALASFGANDLSAWDTAALVRAAKVLPAYPYRQAIDKQDGSPTSVAFSEGRKAARRLRSLMLQQAAADVGGGGAGLAGLARRIDPAPSSDGDWIRSIDSNGETIDTTSRLSPQQTRDVVLLEVRSNESDPVEITALTPTRSLRVTPQVTENQPGSRIALQLQLQPDAPIADLLRTEGALVQVRSGRRVRHVRVPTPELAGACPVEVYLQASGARLAWSERILLPPCSEGIELSVVVVNNADREIMLSADASIGAPFTAKATVGPSSELSLPLELAGEPSDPPWIEAAKIGLRLREDDRLLFDSTAELGVADPGDYVRVRDARLVARPEGDHELRLLVDQLPGAPSPIRMLWSPRSAADAPGPIVVGGSLAAELTATAPSARIRAGLRFPSGHSKGLLAHARINGVERALTWRTSDVTGSAVTTMTHAADPVIHLKADPLVATGDLLNWTAEALGAPQGSRLEVSLEPTRTNAIAGFGARTELNQPRRGVVLAAPSPSGTGVMARCQLVPWERAFKTNGQVGYRVVTARLINGAGEEVARKQTPVAIDGDPPEGARLVAVGPLVAGQPAALEITGVDKLSDVSGVRVYAGLPSGGEPPEGAKPVVAKQANGVWSASLPLPPEAGETIVTAELTNGVGLRTEVSIPLFALSAEAAALGSIVGKVTEATRPQPDLPVKLIDEKSTVIAEAKTDAAGAFRFADLAPGGYRVNVTKEASQRTGAEAVQVEAGVEAQAEVQLTL